MHISSQSLQIKLRVPWTTGNRPNAALDDSLPACYLRADPFCSSAMCHAKFLGFWSVSSLFLLLLVILLICPLPSSPSSSSSAIAVADTPAASSSCCCCCHRFPPNCFCHCILLLQLILPLSHSRHLRTPVYTDPPGLAVEVITEGLGLLLWYAIAVYTDVSSQDMLIQHHLIYGGMASFVVLHLVVFSKIIFWFGAGATAGCIYRHVNEVHQTAHLTQSAEHDMVSAARNAHYLHHELSMKLHKENPEDMNCEAQCRAKDVWTTRQTRHARCSRHRKQRLSCV